MKIKTLEYGNGNTIETDDSGNYHLSYMYKTYPPPKDPKPLKVLELRAKYVHTFKDIESVILENNIPTKNLKIRFESDCEPDEYPSTYFSLLTQRLETKEEMELRLRLLSDIDLLIIKDESDKELAFIKNNADLYDLGKLELKHKKKSNAKVLKKIKINTETDSAIIDYKTFKKLTSENVIKGISNDTVYFTLLTEEEESDNDFISRLIQSKELSLSDLKNNYSKYVQLKIKHNMPNPTLTEDEIKNIITTTFDNFISKVRC